MTNDEFDHALNELGLNNADAAAEMAELGDAKTASSYISAMRRGHKPITAAAAIYVRLKLAESSRAESDSDWPAELRRLAAELETRKL